MNDKLSQKQQQVADDLREEGVLSVLDGAKARRRSTFVSFVSDEAWYLGARLTVYSDRYRWAIVIGELSYGETAAADPLSWIVHSYGNCAAPYFRNRSEKAIERQIFKLPDRKYEEAILTTTGGALWYIGADTNQISIQGKSLSLQFPESIEIAAGVFDPPRGPEPRRPPGSQWAYKVFRALVLRDPQLLLPPDDMMRSRLPQDIPCVLNLSEWHHPSNLQTYPSDTACFRMLARVCATADPGHYMAEEPPNTADWNCW